MGLDIYGKNTEKSIHWGYSRIHNIRTLAFIACQVPKEIALLRMRYGTLDFEASKILPSHLIQIAVTGSLFGNLLFHSDCEGEYTKRGEISWDGKLQKGNILKLHAELRSLINEKFAEAEKYKKEEIPEFWLEDLKEFFELVDDEVKGKRPTIYFS